MNKLIPLAALLLCGSLLTSCAYEPTIQRAVATSVPGTAPLLPEAEAPAALNTVDTAMLFYRYGTQPYLAAEEREVIDSPSQAYEYSLISTLLAGPALQDGTLTPLFPEGTHVVSTSRQDRLLFVTLSAEVLNSYPDEPLEWQSDSEWAEELRLRRTLAIQSLVATVTENCEIDSVQVLVEQSADNMTPSLRLRQSYFMDTEDETLLTGPQSRESNMILSPGTTGQIILDALTRQDWETLYLYLADSDPASGEEKRSYSDFVTGMKNLPALTGYQLEGINVSAAGTQATLTAAPQIMLTDGTIRSLPPKVLHLVHEKGIWRVALPSLSGWLDQEGAL